MNFLPKYGTITVEVYVSIIASSTMVDNLVDANDRDDPSTVVKNPYIKNIPSVTYAEVQAKAIAAAAASRGKSSNSTSSKGSKKTKRKRRQTTQQKRAQVEKCLNTKARNNAIKEAAKAKAKAEEEKKKKEEENA